VKKDFITGLVILTPLALTIVIVGFIINLLTEPFIGIFQSILSNFGLLDEGFLFLSPAKLQLYLAKFLILVFLFLITLGLGFLARWLFLNTLLKFWDSLIHRIPIVNSVYKVCQDVIATIFTSSTSSFKQVVLVKFPSDVNYAIGLITREGIKDIYRESAVPLISVFVPTTPNPTSGFLMMYPESDIIRLKMSVEEAFKFIISCGVIHAPLEVLVERIEKEGLSL